MNKFKKTIAGVLGFAIALSLVVVATSAKADTISDLQAQIANLTQQLSALSGGSILATNNTFNADLTVGSSGATVTALQTWLISQGYSISAGATGYFGAQTKAAVAAYQTANGITPAAGYFGPITRAKVNGAATVAPVGTTYPAGCASSAGYSSTTGQACSTVSTLPAGCSSTAGYSSTTGVSCSTGVSTTGSVVMDGTDGSLTVSTSPYVSRSQTLKKGDTKDIYAVDLQDIGGPVTVNRFDVYFNTRPWLIFNQLVLKDSTGKVIATKTLSSASDATEITTGSDYLVRFDNVNYTVPEGGADTILVVNATVLSSSDKITGQTVLVQVPQGAIRTINGKGYTDSLGLGSEYDASANSLILSENGSNGILDTRIDPSTPDTRNETISTSNTTSGEVLGVFGVKEENQNGQINGLTFAINSAASTSQVFQNIQLFDGSTQYGATSFTNGQAIFTNLSINMTQDQWKSLTLKADVLATTSAFTATATLSAGSNPNPLIVGSDSNYNTLTLNSANEDITANNVTFIPNGGIAITNLTSSKGTVTTPTTGTWLAAYPSLGFTVVNNGNNAIFLSATSTTALAINTNGTAVTSSGVASTTITSVVASGSVTGDTANAYIVQAGASRTFTYNFSIDNTGGSTAAKKVSITQINYGTGEANGTGSGDNAQYNVNFGLQNLYVQVP
jgi:peptidoglycan hydrolase-like protein with peptidoglycan-binding domain